uniref:Uncharacterized protein n=1 Tax=Stomoxys calcitrans TaxID=35570 RepID=A0A1I8Q6W4_STOCA
MKSIFVGLVLVLVLSSYCIGMCESTNDLQNIETSRKKKHHYFLYSFYGWHALSWIYWIKVKLLVVAFFAYTAFIWGLRYIGSYNRCSEPGHVYYGNYRSLEDRQHYQIAERINRSRKRRHLTNKGQ